MPRSPQFVIATESRDSALPAAREKEDEAAAHGTGPDLRSGAWDKLLRTGQEPSS